MAASRSAELGCRTLLLEKNRKPGVKILMSGGTRCNLTHHTDARGIIAAFGSQGRFLHSALASLSPEGLVELFNREGLPTAIEQGTDKIFPASNRALDVQRTLLKRIERTGLKLITEITVTAIAKREDETFSISTEDGHFRSHRLLITSGGMSYPGCGTVGDGYEWARAFGHTVIHPRPALTPLRSSQPWVRELSGITIGDVHAWVFPSNPGKILAELRAQKLNQRSLSHARGSFLFTHKGLSGPVPMNVSRAVTDPTQPGPHTLLCDFLPTQKESETHDWLSKLSDEPSKRTVESELTQRVPKRLVESLMKQSGLPLSLRTAEFSKTAQRRVFELLRRQIIPLNGTLGFVKAEVTAGGIALDEVHSSSMESKLVPGLYFAGEILDLDGPIGGYNFQSAFSTGWLAAESIAESLRDVTDRL